MKALSIIVNRLRWVSLGVYLTLIFIAWLENDSKEKETENTFANYYGNKTKENTYA